jgi:hypothetical protein
LDLSFALPTPADETALPAADMALLVTFLSSRQTASATAQAQAMVGRQIDEARPPDLMAPRTGAFSAAMAARLAAWRRE